VKALTLKKDRTVLLFAIAILFTVASYWEVASSVHTYCENRLTVGATTLLVMITLAFFIGNKAVTVMHKILSGLGVAGLLLAVILNVSFSVWATKTCQNQFEYIRSYQR